MQKNVVDNCRQTIDNWANRLGFKEEKVLILHADDAGLTSAIDDAVLHSLEKNIIQSCSVLVNKGFPDSFLFKARKKDYDIGLHFNPTSLDCKRQIKEQYRYMLKKGIFPSHIDSHSGYIYMVPNISKLYIEHAELWNIPPVIPIAKDETIKRFNFLGLNLQGFDEYAGLRVDDLYVLSLLGGNSYEEKKIIFLNLLAQLKPGITQIVLHLSSDNKWSKWYWEWQLFKDNEVLNKLREFRLTNWKEIWNAYRNYCS